LKIDRRISIDVSDEIKRLVPILGKEKAARLETAYLLADEETRKRILEMIDALKAAVFSDSDMKNSVLMEPPPENLVNSGKLDFGVTLYGKKRLYPVKLKEENFLTHIGVFGSSGYGKTNVVQWMIMNLAKNNIPVLIFDFSKRNYRDLLALPELKDKIQIFTVGRNVSPFRFNPLKPPEGIQISQWAKEFAEIFDHAYWMMGGGRHVILKALDDIYSGENPEYPRIKDIGNWLEKFGRSRTSSRESNWISTAKRPLESLCFRELGDVFDCEEGVLPSDFFKEGKVTILELDALSTNDRTFFIEIILQWIRDAALVSPKREKLMGVIALEEAHHVLNREKSKSLGMETVMDLIFREVRELGLGIIYVDQHPSLISYPALGNTSTHVYMNLGLDTKYSSDILDASNMLGLKYEEEGDYLRRLPVGHAFILMRMLAFPNPFLVEFPLVNIKKGSVDDDLIKEFMQGKLLERVKKARKIQVEEVEEKKDVKIEFDDKTLEIVEVLGNSKGVFSSQIFNEIGLSGSSFKKKVQELIRSGLVGRAKGKSYKQRAHYYFLTDRGTEVFDSKFKEESESSDHDKDLMVNFLISHFSLKGWKVVNSDFDQCVFEKDGEKISVCIEYKMDGERIDKEIKSKDNLYFFCGSKRIKNFVIQKVAKYIHSNSLDRSLLIATPEYLKNKEKFKKIEFKFTESYSQKNKTIQKKHEKSRNRKNLDLDNKTQSTDGNIEK
jgi:DNA-binding MarR family transcriptional regulator